MTTVTIITVGALGFALGLYVSSQIMEHIDNRTRHKRFLDNLNKFDKRENND
jgi:hypothetical protein